MAKEDERSLGQKSDRAGTINDGLSDISLHAGVKLPKNKSPREIIREDYYSIQALAPADSPSLGMPEYIADGYLYTVVFSDGSKTFILWHRTTRLFTHGGRQNPWANMTILGGGDLRSSETFVYEWNGKNTIKVTDPTGKITKVIGKQGTPNALLPTLRRTLRGEDGELRGKKRFTGADEELTPEDKWMLKDLDEQRESKIDRHSADLGLKQGLMATEEGQELLRLLGKRGLSKRGALIFITDNVPSTLMSVPISRGYHRLEVFRYLIDGETRRHLIGFLGGRGRILIGSDDNQQLEETGEMFQAIEYRPDLGAVVIRSGAAKCLIDNFGRRISGNYMAFLVRDGKLYGANGESYEKVRQCPAKSRSIQPIGIAWQDLIKDVES